jgi:hypothetical protein
VVAFRAIGTVVKDMESGPGNQPNPRLRLGFFSCRKRKQTIDSDANEADPAGEKNRFCELPGGCELDSEFQNRGLLTPRR